MSFSVGPGVQESIKVNSDEARSDEMYLTPEISITYGRDAVYYYMKADNQVKRAPFGEA